jgi:membrane protein DedA with SNARE-associated domain
MTDLDLHSLLHTYGYALIFLGTLLEGESLLALGGLFAHQGYLDLRGVIATAFAGAVCGDQLFFHLGRHHAARLLARFPRLRRKVNVTLHQVESHQNKLVLSMRFLWGLRIALPIALGLTTMRAARYFLLDLISAATWSVIVALVGFGASGVFTRIVADFHHYEKWIAVVLIVVAILAVAMHWGRPRRPRDPT